MSSWCHEHWIITGLLVLVALCTINNIGVAIANRPRRK